MISKSKQLWKWSKQKGFLEAFKFMKVSKEEGFLILYNQYPFLRKDLFDAYLYKFYPLEEIDKIIIGNYKQRLNIYKEIEKRQPIIIYGKPGIGKTFFVRRFCESEKYHLIEINSSLHNTEEKLRRRVKFDFKAEGLIKNLVLFFDEVDGLYSTGFKYLQKMIPRAKVPIFMACNNLNKIPAPLRKICKIFKFEKPKNEEEFDLVSLLLLWDEFFFEFSEEDKINPEIRLTPKQIALVAIESPDIRIAINMLKRGKKYDTNRGIMTEEVIYTLFREQDRKIAWIQMEKFLDDFKYPFHVLLVWIAENMFYFFRKEPEKLKHNLKILETVSKSVYLMPRKRLGKTLVFGVQTTIKSGVVRFPKYYSKKRKIDKQRERNKKDIVVRIKKKKKPKIKIRRLL